MYDFEKIEPMVFCLSTGRTGTLTLERLFRDSPEALCWHEPLPHISVFPLDKTRSLWDTRTHLFCQSIKANVGYVELGAHLTFIAYEISKELPQSKFLHLIRDPRYFVRSGVRRGWYKAGRIHAGMCPKEGDMFYKEWPLLAEYERVAWNWRKRNEWIRTFCETLPKERHLTFYSEDLFAGNRLDVLSNFLGLSLPCGENTGKILSCPLNSQSEGEFPKVKDWSIETTNRVLRIVEDELVNYTRYAHLLVSPIIEKEEK